MNLAERAEAVSRELLAESRPLRWAHTRGVARAARSLSLKSGEELDLTVASAWLHDIGYAPDLVDTSFHALDGARFLRDTGWSSAIVNLVAHHSCAQLEARERLLEAELCVEFPREPNFPHDLLCYCDMTTGPNGQPLDVVERLAEIRMRYGPEHLVTRFIAKAEPEIIETVRSVEQRLRLSRGGAPHRE